MKIIVKEACRNYVKEEGVSILIEEEKAAGLCNGARDHYVVHAVKVKEASVLEASHYEEEVEGVKVYFPKNMDVEEISLDYSKSFFSKKGKITMKLGGQL